MNDILLSPTTRQEALSIAYVRAVVAAAGYDISSTQHDLDSIDLIVHAGGNMRPQIGLQLKATGTLAQDEKDHWPFPLKKKNYDDLRLEAQVPRYLVLFRMPETEADYVAISKDSLTLRHCAYWLSLLGREEVDVQTKTVHVPKSNIFDVQGLRNLMKAARSGGTA